MGLLQVGLTVIDVDQLKERKNYCINGKLGLTLIMDDFMWVRVTKRVVRVPETRQYMSNSLHDMKGSSLPIAFCSVLCVD